MEIGCSHYKLTREVERSAKCPMDVLMSCKEFRGKLLLAVAVEFKKVKYFAKIWVTWVMHLFIVTDTYLITHNTSQEICP